MLYSFFRSLSLSLAVLRYMYRVRSLANNYILGGEKLENIHKINESIKKQESVKTAVKMYT